MQLFDFEKTDAKTTYRVRALQEYGAFCNWCGYSDEVKMLDVDHIDSNRSNSKLENLQVLCVWCHALKTRKVKFHQWNGADYSTTGNTKILVRESEYRALERDKIRLDYLDTLTDENTSQWAVMVIEKGEKPLPKVREVVDNLLDKT